MRRIHTILELYTDVIHVMCSECGARKSFCGTALPTMIDSGWVQTDAGDHYTWLCPVCAKKGGREAAAEAKRKEDEEFREEVGGIWIFEEIDIVVKPYASTFFLGSVLDGTFNIDEKFRFTGDDSKIMCFPTIRAAAAKRESILCAEVNGYKIYKTGIDDGDKKLPYYIRKGGYTFHWYTFQGALDKRLELIADDKALETKALEDAKKVLCPAHKYCEVYNASQSHHPHPRFCDGFNKKCRTYLAVLPLHARIAELEAQIAEARAALGEGQPEGGVL